MEFIDFKLQIGEESKQKEDPPTNNRNLDRDFEYYRDKIVTVAGIIITFSTAVFAFILKDDTSNLIREVDSSIIVKVFVYISFFLLFISFIGSILSIYFIIEGYKQQGRNRMNEPSKPHNPIFTSADKLIVWVLGLFGLAMFNLFVIFSVQYFVQ